jgi:hypothetical protein
MKRSPLLAGLAIIVAWSTASPALATLFINEPFNYSFYVTGIPIRGQFYNGSTDRIWQLAASSPNNTAGIAIGNGDLGGSDTNSVSMTSTPGTVGAADRLGINSNPTMAGDVTSGTIYYSFHLNIQSLQGLGSNFALFFGLNNEDNASTASAPTVIPGRIYARVNQSGQTFDLAVANNRQTTNVITSGDQAWSSNVAAYSGGLKVGQTYFIVGAYDLAAAKSSLWINPSGAYYGTKTPPPADRVDTTAGNSFSPGIGSALLVQNQVQWMYFDELRVANTWAEAAPTSGLAGDYNHDGVVNAADYTVWRDGLGTRFTQSYYDAWRLQFGQTAGSGAGSDGAVPEPSTLALSAIVCVAPFAGRRKQCIRRLAIHIGSARLRSRWPCFFVNFGGNRLLLTVRHR